MHGVSVAHDVCLVGLPGLLVLLLQIDDVAGQEGVFLVQVVVLHQLLPAYPELSAQQAEGVSLPDHDVDQAVGQVCLVRVGQPGFLLQQLLPASGLAFGHPFRVVFIQVIVFDDGNEAVGVGPVCGVTCLLQALGPASVVGYLQLEQEAIAGAVGQELGMVLIRVLHPPVGTKALVAGVVVIIHLPPPPTVALDAEMVVALAGQTATPCPALQQPLCQRDAGRDAVFVHLVDGQVGILLDILVIGGVPVLGLRRHADQHQQYKQAEREGLFHAFIRLNPAQKSAKDSRKTTLLLFISTHHTGLRRKNAYF